MQDCGRIPARGPQSVPRHLLVSESHWKVDRGRLQHQSMENHEFDGMSMSKLDIFNVSVPDKYNQDKFEILDAVEEDNLDCHIKFGVGDNEIESLFNEIELTCLEPMDGFTRYNDGVGDFSSLNDVSDWVNDTIIDEHMLENNKLGKNSIAKGMFFASKESVVHACQRYSILNRVEYHTYKSDKDRLILKCRGGKKNCTWHVRAVKKKKAPIWEITRYGEAHTCETNINPKDNVHLNKHFIALEIKDLLQKNLKLSPKDIKQIMSKKYGYDIPYLKAWNARQKALKFLLGDCKEPFIQPCNDHPMPYRLNAHDHSSYVRSLVRSCQTAADIFLNDPIPRTKKLAFDLFHVSLAELVELGEESALNIDPALIQLSSGDPAEGQMTSKQSGKGFMHGPSSQLTKVGCLGEASRKKSKRPKRKLDQISFGP